MEFVFLDMVRSIPQISASGYFNISKRLFPQVNFNKKTPTYFMETYQTISLFLYFDSWLEQL